MGQPDREKQYSVTAEFYDHIVPYRERQDIEFFVELAREADGPVLEVGCGTGRILIPTARAGVEITGLDVSPAMLSVCREQLEREPAEVRARVTLVEADMRDFDLGGGFALATTPFRSFQHIVETDEQVAALRNIHAHLVDGGRFVLDVFNPDLSRLTDEAYLNYQEVEPEFTMPDGRKVVRMGRNLSRNLVDQTVDVEMAHHVTHPDGSEETLTDYFRLRYFFRFEIERLLELTGFAVDLIYADYDKSPLGSKEPGELLFIARKV